LNPNDDVGSGFHPAAGFLAGVWSFYIRGAGPWPAAASQAVPKPWRIAECRWHYPSVVGRLLFIAFRWHDSLPAQRPFPASNPTSGEAFVAMDPLLDHARCGPAFLRQPAKAQLVPTSIQYGAEIGHYELHSWVIMPHRVHLLLTPRASVSKLSGSLKAATAKRANLLLQRSGQPVTALLAARPERYAWSSAGRAACEAAAGQGPAPRM
jgi:hypothetical protein